MRLVIWQLNLYIIGSFIYGTIKLVGPDRVPILLQQIIGVLFFIIPTLVGTTAFVINFQSRFLKYLALFLLAAIVLIVGTALVSHAIFKAKEASP
jgi:hypothetical protein